MNLVVNELDALSFQTKRTAENNPTVFSWVPSLLGLDELLARPS